ncbi:MAG: hypothetical protein U0002_19185 [Thermoanaerobaculia bacterium]
MRADCSHLLPLLQEAQRLAALLTEHRETAVKRGLLLSVTADFLGRGGLPRLLRTLEALGRGSGGHLRRGGGYRDQMEALLRVLSAELPRFSGTEEELKTVLGWTGWLLATAQNPDLATSPAPREKPAEKPTRNTKPDPPEPLRSAGFGLSSKNQAALAGFLDRSPGHEKHGKKSD